MNYLARTALFAVLKMVNRKIKDKGFKDEINRDVDKIIDKVEDKAKDMGGVAGKALESACFGFRAIGNFPDFPDK